MLSNRTNSERTPGIHASGSWPLALLIGSVCSAVALLANFWLTPNHGTAARPPQDLLAASRSALSAGRFDDAERLAATIPLEHHLASAALLIAGESATRRGDLEAAIGYYRQVPAQSDEFASAIYALGELYRNTCRWQEAIDCYRQTLEVSPTNLDCKERLAFLLGVSGQRWETIPLFMELVRSGRWSLESLAIFADIERPIEQLELVTECYQQNRSDQVIQLARASHHITDGQLKAARAILEPLVNSQPESLSAQEQLGEVLFGLNDFQALTQWSQELPPTAENSPQVWFLRGRLSRQFEQHDLAASCFSKSLQLAPEHRQATYQLGQVLSKLGQANAQAVIRRAEVQAEMGQQLDQALGSQGAHEPNLKKIAESCLELGRYLEAQAWAQTAVQTHGDLPWSRDVIQKTQVVLRRSSPRTLSEYQAVEKFSLAKFASLASTNAISKVNEFVSSAAASSSIRASRTARVRFGLEDKLGLKFTYFNGQDPATVGARMFEQTGGGVGVLDYDNDGFPDIYLTQGSQWKTGDLSPTLSQEYSDALFRNLDGSDFREVSSLAGISELNFGQGLTAADLNHDGFEDLLVCNIGLNRLFMNSGDGTFIEATQSLTDQVPSWSTSCCIVDLNLDGLPDIYELNYVQGKDVYTLICNGKGCSPAVFDGSPNQCWLNGGDGSFVPVPMADGESKLSKSLGIVALILEGDRYPSLFIANDQVRNFLLRVESAQQDMIQLSDESLLRGLALNADGLPLACMGIAADDIDNSGTIDLLVTNFANESNSMYLQDSAGFFTDAIGGSGMQMASYSKVGWGTQFIDADRDGYSDAVVVNGHVDDYTDKGQGYEMVAQFFLNTGNGQFQLQTSDQIGEFFQQLRLGRSVARLDWNRDGLMEFVVSNMNSPACLLTNETQAAGSYINLQLVGTNSARHPVGATVKVTTDIGSWKKQIIAGDGYQCCNQKLLQFGLGQAGLVRSVEVVWPSGATTQASELALNSTWLIVEGLDLPHQLAP